MNSVVGRFMAKALPIPEAGCWLWTGAVQCTGYGRFSMGDGTVEYAHRAAWQLFSGAIPRGMYVCHKCDTPLCVNPDHLFIGSAKDNMRDAARKNRIVSPARNWASDETHQPAKLTNDQVRYIRESSEGLSVLARRYHVTPKTIWAARTRQTFKDVA